jgi:hypothetical protein
MPSTTYPYHRRLQLGDILAAFSKAAREAGVPALDRSFVVTDLAEAARELMDRAVLEADLNDDRVAQHFARCDYAGHAPIVDIAPDGKATASCYGCDYVVTGPAERAAVTAYFGVTPAPVFDPIYLIWSNQHHMWWGPDRSHYTSDPWQAGRYSETEAAGICDSTRTDNNQLPRAVKVPAPEQGHTRLSLYQIQAAPSILAGHVNTVNAANRSTGYRMSHISGPLMPGEYRITSGRCIVCCTDCEGRFIVDQVDDNTTHPDCPRASHGDPGE